ncbi:putative tryptase 5 [Operophtera brumata]|uniref:Putative tryptase 5 n=1 Tax=Operophtera brumata TaxID=104452 RepID=A0A0L7LAS9_OPEBR|nr:putative tryptase 5 [Operophtera brumata]
MRTELGVVYFLSQAMMFCVGTLIEAHVVLTPASCVFGEKHKFNLSIFPGYNHSQRWTHCAADNIALLVFDKEYSFHSKEDGMDYVVNRIRYLSSANNVKTRVGDKSCRYYGWGSRRNDDLGSILVCSGFAEGMMTSRLIDRPCGVGFLDLANYNKFLTCGVDDARDVIGAFASEAFDYSTPKPPAVKILITPPPLNNTPKDIETIKTVVKEEVQAEAEA